MPLTPEQQRAVEITDRDVGVLASAGSGKTTVLSAHYETLVMREREPINRILVFTFTDKAANELKRRIETTLNRSGAWDTEQFWSEAWIGTLHHFCSRLCRQNAKRLGLMPDFTILETALSLTRFDDSLSSVVQEALSQSPEIADVIAHYGIDRTLDLLGELHEKKCPVDQFPSLHGAAVLARLYARAQTLYQNDKQLWSTLDFDDLEQYALHLLSEFPEIRARYRALFSHILVDEFQDLNGTQGRLIELLWQPGKNRLFFVGDPKQSIYGFRGATVQVFYEFWNTLGKVGGERVVLSENWRAAPALIDFTNTLFTPLFENAPIPYTPLIATQPTQGHVIHRPLSSTSADERRREEAVLIAAELESLHSRGTTWKQIAVLARSSTCFPYLTSAFDSHRIPYDIQKTNPLLHEPFLLLLQNMFFYLLNQNDPVAKLGILRSNRFSLSLAQALAATDNDPHYFFQRLETGGSLVDGFERLRRLYEESENRSFFQNAYDSFLYFRFLDYLETEEERGVKSALAWQTWLRHLAQNAPAAPKKSLGIEDKVSVLSVHAAKGLEFEAVFLANLSGRGAQRRDFILKNEWHQGDEPRIAWQEMKEKSGLKRVTTTTAAFDFIKEKYALVEAEESKRLFYVAVTRAKQFLFCATVPLSASKCKTTKSMADLSSWNDWLAWHYINEYGSTSIDTRTDAGDRSNRE